MRNLVWTIIIIWLVYQLVNIFKKKPSNNFSEYSNKNNEANFNASNPSQKDKIKDAIHKQADKAGDYVDFEEIK